MYTGVDLGFRKGGANLCDCGSLAASSQLFCVHGKWVAGVGYPGPFLHEAEKPSEYAIIQWPREHFTSLDLGIFGRNETSYPFTFMYKNKYY